MYPSQNCRELLLFFFISLKKCSHQLRLPTTYVMVTISEYHECQCQCDWSSNYTTHIRTWATNKQKLKYSARGSEKQIKSTEKYTSIQVDRFHCSEYIAAIMTITVLYVRDLLEPNKKSVQRKMEEMRKRMKKMKTMFFLVNNVRKRKMKAPRLAERVCCDRSTFNHCHRWRVRVRVCVWRRFFFLSYWIYCVCENLESSISWSFCAGCPVFDVSSWFYVYFQNEMK